MSQSPMLYFHSEHYQQHNWKRLEHLSSLGLELNNKTVLEVGAGIGDHSSFFLERNCQLTITEARLENLEILHARYPEIEVKALDLDEPALNFATSFDLVYCYGLLYHLKRPADAIAFMSEYCHGTLLLETCVSLGTDKLLNPCPEPISDPTQSFWGMGCRPTREWVFNQLKERFEFVYLPTTQPNHEEFPLDWNVSSHSSPYTRAVFIASRIPIYNPLLVEYLPMKQSRCE